MTQEPIDSSIYSIEVPEGIHEIRADKIVAEAMNAVLSRMQVQRLFEEGKVILKTDDDSENEESFDPSMILPSDKVLKKSERVSSGQRLVVQYTPLAATTLEPADMPLDILYEDKDIIIINKAAGMVVHPGNGTGLTLVQGVLAHCKGSLSPLGGELRPGVVHRLDKDTSGVILFAKTDTAYLRLIEMFANREIHKEYLAIVSGVPRLLGGSIHEKIQRHATMRVKMQVGPAGRDAHTDWMVEKMINKYCTLIRCILHTGRTHQIRVHLSHIQHPILGDNTYGYRSNPHCNPSRVMLHAESLRFNHPVTGQAMEIQSPLPKDFSETINI